MKIKDKEIAQIDQFYRDKEERDSIKNEDF